MISYKDKIYDSVKLRKLIQSIVTFGELYLWRGDLPDKPNTAIKNYSCENLFYWQIKLFKELHYTTSTKDWRNIINISKDSYIYFDEANNTMYFELQHKIKPVDSSLA